MKKFVVQVFQQKYYLLSKPKETSSTSLKDVLQTKRNTTVINLINRANTKKQLKSAQKFIISFIFDLIWNKITCPFVEIITPSIIKPQQLNKIIDFRNHHGFCQELELLQKSRTKSYSRINTLPNVVAHNCNVKDSTNNVISENKINSISPDQKYSKIIYQYHTEDSQLKNRPCISNRSAVHDSNNVDKKVKQLITVKNETLDNFEYQQENYISKSSLQTNSNKIDPPLCVSTKDSNLNEPQKQNNVGIEHVILENNNNKTSRSGDTLSNRQTNTNNKSKNNKQDGIERGTKNNMSHVKQRHEDMLRNSLPRDVKSKKDFNKYPTKKSYPAINNRKDKKLSEHIHLIDQKTKNKEGLKKPLSGDNAMLNTDEFLNKGFNESKQIKNQKSAETKPYLHDKSVKINQAVQLQLSKSYKFKKRKAKQEKRTKKQASKLNPKEEITQKSKDKSKITTKKAKGSKVLEDTDFQSTSVFSNTSKQSKSNMVRNNLEDNDKSTLKFNKDVDLNSTEFSDENKTNPGIIKTSLISFDTTDDYAQLVIRDQSVGEEIKSDFVNLKTVMSEENAPKQTKSKNTETHDPIRTMDMRSKVKFKRSDGKIVKTATIKPWKMTKDMTEEFKIITEGGKNSDALKRSKKDINEDKKKKEQTAEKLPKNLPSPVDGASQQDEKFVKNSAKTVTTKSLFGKKRQKSILSDKTLPLQPTNLKKPLSDVNLKLGVKEKVIFKEKSLSEEQSSLKKNDIKSAPDIEIQNKNSKNIKVPGNTKTTAFDSRKNNDCVDGNVLNSKHIKSTFKPKLENIEMSNKLKHNTLENQNASARPVMKNEYNHLNEKTNVKTASVKKTASNIQTNTSSDKKIDTKNQLYNSDQSVVAFELKSKTNSLLNQDSAILPDTRKVSKLSNENSNVVKSKKSDFVEVGRSKTNEEKSVKKDINGVKNLDSKNITTLNDVGKTQSQSPLTSKYTASSRNKTNFDSKDDLSLSEAVAYINQGVNKIHGKEEFKFKIKKLLHNFTFTGQKNGENRHEPFKTQDMVDKNHETKNKLTKAISQKSLRGNTSEKEKLQIKTESINLLNKINSTSKDTESNKTVIQAIKIVHENTSLKTAGKLDTSNKHPKASIRPALKLSKDVKNHASVAKDEGESIKQPGGAKIRNTTNVTSIKAKTVLSSKIEPKKNITEGATNQSIPNNTFNKTTTKNITPSVTSDKFASKTEKLSKPVKRR